MTDTPKCNCREDVNALVDNGRLRDVLMGASGITERQADSIVRQACDRRSVRSVAVDNGRFRDALSYASWSQNHIDFLLYRSMHEHEHEDEAQS